MFWIRKIKIINLPILLKLIFIFNEISVNIPENIYAETPNWWWNTSSTVQTFLENEEKCSGFICSDVKSYSRAKNQTQWCTDKRIDPPKKSIHHNRESVSSTYIVRRYFDQGAKSIQLEYESPFLTNGVRNTGDMYLNIQDINMPELERKQPCEYFFEKEK